MGNPIFFRFIGCYFASLGFPTILAGYRSAPRYKHPIQNEDILHGYEAGRKALEDQGLGVRKVILGGQSAGAQLVSLFAYGKDDAVRQCLPQGDIAGLLLISGPLVFYLCLKGAIFRLIDDYVEDVGKWVTADPYQHIEGTESIPVLCVHGEKDPLVSVQNSLHFTAQIKNGYGNLFIVMGGHHSDLIRLFWKPDHPATQLITGWLERYGGSNTSSPPAKQRR
jgi:acetyl esterase/lipase